MTNDTSKPPIPHTSDAENNTNRLNYNPTLKNSFFSSISSSLESFTDEYSEHIRIGKIILFNCLVGAYFAWATIYFFQQSSYYQRNMQTISVRFFY